MKIKIKRIYEPAEKNDGYRVLVDRLWPRGITKEFAALNLWSKEMAPSNELRRCFNHQPERFVEFSERYYAELTDKKDRIKKIIADSGEKQITLLYAARNKECNHAIVLNQFLSDLYSLQ